MAISGLKRPTAEVTQTNKTSKSVRLHKKTESSYDASNEIEAVLEAAIEATVEAEKVLPRNDLEKRLASIWLEFLSPNEISIHSDFFALGGSSLLAVGIVSRISDEFNLDLLVRDFFANPTITTQARHIRQMLDLNTDESEIDESNQERFDLRNRLPKIFPVYFDCKKERLFGIHYKPQNHQQLQSHTVLICHPLGHEYARSYRNLQQLSLQLAKAGFDTFRFDYVGTGNSSGKTEEAKSSDYVQNIEAAAQYIRQKNRSHTLSVIAVRMGAPLVIRSNIGERVNLILWDPAVKGLNYIQLMHKFHNAALSKLERFRVRRKVSERRQLFGFATSQAQELDLKNLEIPDLTTLITNNISLVTSASYLVNEPGLANLVNHCQHYPTKDEIQWHNRLYTESAFSSPEAFKVIMKLLKGEKQ